jgi:hypothetical protein
MERVYVPAIPVTAPPPKGTNGWILRNRRRVMYATTAGLFQETPEGLHRVMISDSAPRATTVAGLVATVDASTTAIGERVWRLPPAYAALMFEDHVFSPRPMAPVRLVFVLLNGEPYDLHLEVDQGVAPATLNEDASTLLSGLKSCSAYTPCSVPLSVPSS